MLPFWDVQAGVRYSEDKNNRNSNRIDGVIGLLGLAPYFFETKAYLYGGENNFWEPVLSLIEIYYSLKS